MRTVGFRRRPNDDGGGGGRNDDDDDELLDVGPIDRTRPDPT
jgi:hypothetical protein